MEGSQIKALRKSAGMTQAQLGEAIGLSRVTIGLMERDQAPVEKRTWLAVLYVTQSETSADSQRHPK